MRVGGLVAIAAVLAVARPSAAATYAVGPGRKYPDLQAISGLLKPGDRVEVDGGAAYPGGVIFREPGAAGAKITITGRRVRGLRPVIRGGVTTIEARADHYVIEGLEIEGGTSRCFYHHANDVTLRDSVIHDCPGHGVLGADSDAGSLTLSYVEVYRAGRGDSAHPVYMATDEEAFPGSVFRMEHCFIHDATGGNSVKSRAERNEIYGNWIEGALYHELELIGPDGASRKRAREDSDVVGNVIRKLGPGYAVRVGGDGSGETDGRYRFVNNTIILGREARAALRVFGGIECVQMDNNAFAREGGGPVRIVVEDQARWTAGRVAIAGSNNWIPMGSAGVPAGWTRTLAGRDPGFVSDLDLHLAPGSPLIGAGAPTTAQAPGFEIARPLAAPRDLPPARTLERVGAARARLRGGADIGAFSYEGPASAPAPAPPPPAPPRGCGCRRAGDGDRADAGAIVVVILAMLRRKRRRAAPVKLANARSSCEYTAGRGGRRGQDDHVGAPRNHPALHVHLRAAARVLQGAGELQLPLPLPVPLDRRAGRGRERAAHEADEVADAPVGRRAQRVVRGHPRHPPP